MGEPTFRDTLLLGAYLFASGSYIMGAYVYVKLRDLIASIRNYATNHQAHEIIELQERVTVLERKNARG